MNTIQSDISALATGILPQGASAPAAAKGTESTARGDRVSISPEARVLSAELVGTQKKQDKETAVFTEADWQSRYGVKSGTQTLANGNKQEVTITGGKLEILEYDGDKLVKSITGNMTENSLSLDAEIYDENGKVSKTIHSDLTQLEGDAAKMSRTIEWYDGDEQTKSMQETMTLSSLDGSGDVALLLDTTQADSVDTEHLEAAPPHLSQENYLTSYFASIQEYQNGRLSRDTSIEQKGAYTQQTNRYSQTVQGMEEHSTKELQHSLDLSVFSKEYDADGKLLRTVDYKDSHSDGQKKTDGHLEQRLTVSWYADGKLVRTGSGTLQMDEAENASLPKRPSFLELFQLKEEDYATSAPLSSEKIFTKKIGKSAGDADYFTNALRSYMGRGAYDTAEFAADRGVTKNPYSLTWESNLYNNGELVAHLVDKESARLNTRNPGLSFRVGGALTEDVQNTLLRSTEHVEENYEDGRLTNRSSLGFKESYEEREEGADALKTRVTSSNSDDLQSQPNAETLNGGVLANDLEPRAASRGMAAQMEQVLEDFYMQLRDAR